MKLTLHCEKIDSIQIQPGAKRHHMVSGTLAPLYRFWVKVGLKRGSGPDRGRSPVEWGDFPSVRQSVRPSVPPLEGPRASQAGLRASQPGLRASQADLRASQAGFRASQAGL